MIILHGIERIRNVIIKKTKRERLNSAKYRKTDKSILKQLYNHSITTSQPNIHSNNLFEENKTNINRNNNYLNLFHILEKEKNIFNQTVKIPKLNNRNEKTKTAKELISNHFEDKANNKNNCVFLTYKDNTNNITKKKHEYNPININKFILEINSFLLPNEQTFEYLKNLINYRLIAKELPKYSNLNKLFQRNNNSNQMNTFELFFKYIIKNTFKEVLKKGYSKNVLINKKEIKEEYQKQLNEIKQFLQSQNKENKDLLNEKFLESFEKSKYAHFTTTLNENKKNVASNKNYRIQCKMF